MELLKSIHNKEIFMEVLQEFIMSQHLSDLLIQCFCRFSIYQ